VCAFRRRSSLRSYATQKEQDKENMSLRKWLWIKDLRLASGVSTVPRL
jgi:hypothetical protein